MDVELVKLLEPYRNQKGALITVLQKVQERYGYLPKDSLSEVAKLCRTTVSNVFGVASFYAQFYFSPRGRHTIKCCVGTACHVRGGQRILESVERELETKAGGTTSDGRFSVEKVACFGSCALGPVIVIDRNVYGRMTPTKVKSALENYR